MDIDTKLSDFTYEQLRLYYTFLGHAMYEPFVSGQYSDKEKEDLQLLMVRLMSAAAMVKRSEQVVNN